MKEARTELFPLSRLRTTLTWRVVVNAGWAFASTPISLGLGIIQTGMMARMLGPEGLGTVTLFTAVCALFGSILKIESAETVMVYATRASTEGDGAEAKHIIRYCYTVDFLSSLVAFSAVALSALFLPRLLNLASGVEWLQVVFGFTLIFQSTYWTSHALLRVADRFAWTFYQSITQSVLKTILIGLLFVGRAGIDEVVLFLVGLSFLDGISLFIMAHFALRRKGLHHAGQSTSQWWCVPGEVWRFQMLGYGRSITKRLYGNLDSLMIGYLSDPTAVGLFRSAKQLTNLLRIPTQALVSSLSPEYSRLWFSNDKKRMRRLVLRFSLFSLLIVGLLGLCLAFFSDQIIRIILGDAFLLAKTPLLVLILAALLGMAMTPFNAMQTATGRAGPSMVAGIATIVTQAALMTVLVPRHGIYGGAWANVGGLLASMMIMLPTGIAHLGEQPHMSGSGIAASETD